MDKIFHLFKNYLLIIITIIAMSEEIYTSLTNELTNKAKLEGELIFKGRSSKTNVYSI